MRACARAAASDPAARVQALHRFAVKGLGFDALRECRLERGACFPNDRSWALLRREELACFDPHRPQWVHKMKFYAACSSARAMASLSSSFADASGALRVCDRASGGVLLEAPLGTEEGRTEVERFFSDFLSRAEGRPADVAVVSAGAGRSAYQFGNTQAGIKASGNEKTIHLVSLATVRDLSRAVGESIDPLRFRANILLDGLDPWEEFEWVGRVIAVGRDVHLKVVKRTIRCEATTVDLATAKKGLDIPSALTKHFPQHGPYLGVYAQVVRAGTIYPGDAVRELAWW